jgi:glutaredoxin
MKGQRKKIRLYALSACPSCKRVKQFLDNHNIAHEYIEVDLLDSGEQWVASKDLKKYNPQASYPTLIIEDVIIGFDEEALKEALDIK